jgi:(p)ppGpp synthase/HD superfamily hydrolase
MDDHRGAHPIPAVAPRFERAVRLATRGHHFQFRKQDHDGSCCATEKPLPETCVPYVSHLMGVVAILAELGADDRTLAAAVLHDYLEDVPDPKGADAIREATDDETLALVRELTEDKRDHIAQEHTWDVRKREQLEAMHTMSNRAVTIKAADLLHNVSSLVFDLREASRPESVWSRFNAGRNRQLWYFEQVTAIVHDRLGHNHRLCQSLDDAIAAVRALG